ncbi:MAG: ABC transporter ATP-binding protein/permease [Chromatiales bacterium]|nr:ABC transporter ATP-binding protein/permease [Gammaproteobacteria bacterium]MBW6476734.1 ABC transporter ATP-binding protein/permease [Chromatiales bacterium]
MHIKYTEQPESHRRDWRTIRSLLPYLWNYRGRAGLALAFLVLSKVAIVGVPLALKEIVDALDSPEGRAVALPIALLLAYGLLRLAGSAFNELRDVVFAKVRHGTMRELALKSLEHLHKLSLRYHLERKTGALSRDMERGTRSASSLLNYMLFSILPTAVELGLITLILLSQYQPRYALIVAVMVTIYVTLTILITNWRMKYRHRMNTMDSEANSQAIDSLINYETVKYFNNEQFEQQRYGKTLQQWQDAAVMSQTSMSGLNITQGAIIAVGVTLIMIFAAQEVIAGTMSLGDLVLVNAFMLQVFIPLNFLGVVYSQVKHALSDMDRMFKLLQENPEIRDDKDAPALEVGEGEIRFEQVSFHYQPERAILRELSFTVPAGKKLAVVGHSGAGKSTLARLLFRFYDVSGGRILINGQDIRQVSQQSLRKAIGIVPQDTVLFNDSIGYNIAYGRCDASQAAIEEAARMANIHDFIASLPDGYETVVGERGLKLSGGEKQRIAIARAVLKNPRILIFDEATSSLDSRSEKTILDALQQLAHHHTTLVIAHRLSTIVDADQILVMDQGQLVEQGSHQVLLAQGGHYAQMWALQQEEQNKEEFGILEPVEQGVENP